MAGHNFLQEEQTAGKAGVLTLTSSTSLSAGQVRNYKIVVANKASAITLTLPVASSVYKGKFLLFVNKGAGVLTLAVAAGFGGKTATIPLSQGDEATVTCDGSYWYCPSGVVALSGTTTQTLTIDNDNVTGTFILSNTQGGTDHSTTLKTQAPSGASIVLTLPSTTGTVALTTDTQTDLDLGSSGTAGSLDIFPTTAANGKLIFTSTDMGGAWNMSITNDAISSARAYSIPDAGGDGQFVMTTTAHSLLVNVNGSDRTADISGDLAIAGDFTTAGGAATITVPAGGANITVAADVAFTGAFNSSFTIPDASTWAFPAGGGTLAVTTGAETGTTSGIYTLDNDSATGQFAMSVGAAGTNHTVTLYAPKTTQAVSLTLPDAATDTICAIAATQTLAAKTLTAPVINGATTAAAANNFVLHTATGTFSTPTGIFTHYGNVANNGNVTWTWSSSGAWDMSGSSGTFLTPTGNTTIGGNVTISGSKTFASGTGTFGINGDVTIAAGKDLVFTAGTGYLEMNGSVSGGIKLDPTATGTALTTITNSNCAAVTITTPTATGIIALTAQADGTIARSDLTQEALAKYRIPLMNVRTGSGLVLDATGGAGLFKISAGGTGSGTLVLVGEDTSSNTKTDIVMFEWAVPPEYVASETIECDVTVKVDESGVGVAGTETLQVECFEVGTDGTAGADLASGGAQDLTAGGDVFQTITSTITDAGVAAGDKLIFVITGIVTETNGTAVHMEIGDINVQCDIKG